ncbi:MAG: C-terminal binding protein [Deltaproteobacteria bacterium]|nr:C-terminal binding protein [Deltaproteobacteria bacterium]
MSRYRVVVTDHLFSSMEEEQEIFRRLDADLVVGQCRGEEETLALTREADAILNTYAPMTAKVVNSLERCRVIVRFGIGVDNVAVEAATAAGIMVANTSDYCIEEVADQAMALLLACGRGLFPSAGIARAAAWDFNRMPRLARMRGQTLGLLGLGRIGSAVAERAKGFAMKILASEIFRKAGVEPVGLDRLLGESDFVSIHVPLNPETSGLVNGEALTKMKPTAYLINVARGKIVDQAALCRALQERRIAGAALDVLETEPPRPDDPIRSLDNVILTPHAAWYSEQSRMDMRRKAVGQVVSVLKGELPYSLVNREVLGRIGTKNKKS